MNLIDILLWYVFDTIFALRFERKIFFSITTGWYANGFDFDDPDALPDNLHEYHQRYHHVYHKQVCAPFLIAIYLFLFLFKCDTTKTARGCIAWPILLDKGQPEETGGEFRFFQHDLFGGRKLLENPLDFFLSKVVRVEMVLVCWGIGRSKLSNQNISRQQPLEARAEHVAVVDGATVMVAVQGFVGFQNNVGGKGSQINNGVVEGCYGVYIVDYQAGVSVEIVPPAIRRQQHGRRKILPLLGGKDFRYDLVTVETPEGVRCINVTCLEIAVGGATNLLFQSQFLSCAIDEFRQILAVLGLPVLETRKSQGVFEEKFPVSVQKDMFEQGRRLQVAVLRNGVLLWK